MSEVRPALELVVSRVGDPQLVQLRIGQIIEAAMGLFLEKGFGATTIADISVASGLSPGSIYRYVEKKEDILLLTLDSILSSYTSAVSDAIADKVGVCEQLRAGIDAYYRVVDKQREKVLLAFRETRSLDWGQRKQIKARELETNRLFESILLRGAEEGLFRELPVDLVAYNIVNTGHMWAAKYWYFSKKLHVSQYIAFQTNWFLQYIVK